MSVVIETTVGDITVDLFLSERPTACLNFLKLCKIKYYNYNLFHTISRGFIAQTGDPTGSRSGGESVFGILDGPLKRFFEGENEPRIKHTKMGLISFVGNEERMIGSQFFLTLGEDLTYLDEKHCVFGEVVEGFDILEIINEVICDTDDRPYQDVRVTHTVILDDPYPDPKRIVVPSKSPSPSAERLQGGRIAPDEEIDEMEGKNIQEMAEMQAEREAKARATILEMVGDLPDADMAPPENVLFVCKLNPVTNDDDLEIIFSRFGKIKSCEVIRDKKTGDSLQYAFVEFEDQKACEDAYFKMDNVLIDDRRIHVDFSQSVSKVRWHGKGRGVTHYDERGNETRSNNDIGKGNYQHKRNESLKKKSESQKNKRFPERTSDRLKSPTDYRGYPKKSTGSFRAPGRDTNKPLEYSWDQRDSSLSPKRKRDFNLPKSSEARSGSNKIHKHLKENEDRSKRNRDRSLSSKRRTSPSHKTNRDITSSPERERSRSKNYINNKDKHRDKSKSPKRSSDRQDRHYNERQKYVATSSKKVSSGDKKKNYSPERKIDGREIPVSKDKRKSENKRSHSDSEGDARKSTATKKKSEYCSGSSESDSDKKVKVQKYNDSSESGDSKRRDLKKKKDVKKNRYESSTDSDNDYKSKKSKKQNKKHESE